MKFFIANGAKKKHEQFSLLTVKSSFHSPVAQLVERLTVNQNVDGSSPSAANSKAVASE